MYQQVERLLTKIRDLELGNARAGSYVLGFVRSTGAQSQDTTSTAMGYLGGQTQYTSLASLITAHIAAIAAGTYTSSRDFIVYVLPGHSESVGTTLLSGLTTGSGGSFTVVGLGDPALSNGPTLLWSGASHNIAASMANVTFANLRMRAAADNITEAITVTGEGFRLIDCHVDMGVDATNDAASFLNFSTGANNGMVAACDLRCVSGANTTMIKTSAVVDNLQIVGNRCVGASQSTTLGNIHIPGAITNFLIAGNIVEQTIASGTAAISFADVACTGTCAYNMLGCLANTTVQQGGIVLAGTSNILAHFYENRNSDGVKGTSGALSPTVTT